MQAQERWYADNIALRGQVVADVGANVGRLSQFFWDASGCTSRVVSIEPLPENAAAIRERIRSAGADRWTVESCAVSGRKGSVALAVVQSADGLWNSMVTQGKSQRTVPARTLSALVPDATIVKLDIEGHEYGVIEEALPKLGRAHTWAVELHMVAGQPLQRVLGAFMAEGFRVYAAAAGAQDGAWTSEEVAATLDWSAIPATRLRPDGSAFKMLHVIAKRDLSAP